MIIYLHGQEYEVESLEISQQAEENQQTIFYDEDGNEVAVEEIKKIYKRTFHSR